MNQDLGNQYIKIKRKDLYCIARTMRAELKIGSPFYGCTQCAFVQDCYDVKNYKTAEHYDVVINKLQKATGICLNGIKQQDADDSSLNMSGYF